MPGIGDCRIPELVANFVYSSLLIYDKSLIDADCLGMTSQTLTNLLLTVISDNYIASLLKKTKAKQKEKKQKIKYIIT